jgi:hypothetical protein
VGGRLSRSSLSTLRFLVRSEDGERSASRGIGMPESTGGGFGGEKDEEAEFAPYGR